MTNMLETVIPKSDQLNFDDLSGGRTLTVLITKVSGKSGDQPICINYENDGGKPYYPCKSMRRVLIHNWGANGKDYVGRSFTLYGDPSVKFGGLEVGGIRISHMSNITKEVTLALTASKASRKPFTVRPVIVAVKSTDRAAYAEDYIEDIKNIPTIEGLQHKFSEATKLFKDSKDFVKIVEAKNKRKEELSEVKAP